MVQKQTEEIDDREEGKNNEIPHDDITDEQTKADSNTIADESGGEEWKAKAEEYLEDWKRTQAEFENYKKRQAASQKELGGYLIEKLLLDIIPVLDNFRAATLHVPDEQKESPWVVGIQYIEKQLEDVIRANGVEVIEVQEGDAFDPAVHEAVSHEREGEEKEAEGPEPAEGKEKQTVSKVLQKGFKVGGKVIRPAKVTIR